MRILEPVVYAFQHSTGWTCCLPSPLALHHQREDTFFFNLLSYTQSRGTTRKATWTRVQEYDFFPPEWAATRKRVRAQSGGGIWGWEQLLSAIWWIKKQGVTGQSVACKFKNLRLHSSRAEQITDNIAAFTGTTLLAIGHSTDIPGRSQQSASTVFRKHTFHTRGTHYTQINPLLIPTLLNWTRFRKQKQTPLGRLEERQRSFSSKPKGPKHVHFSRPEVSHSRSLRNHIRSCLRGGREVGMETLFYQVPPGLLQLPELHFELRLLFWGE